MIISITPHILTEVLASVLYCTREEYKNTEEYKIALQRPSLPIFSADNVRFLSYTPDLNCIALIDRELYNNRDMNKVQELKEVIEKARIDKKAWKDVYKLVSNT